ncbi:PAPS reductase-like domain protein [Mycobacterium phage prophiGD39-2]|nr:PAPS reductase-like domain protein [Mycobacterium phage phiGD57-1]QST88877.1 PAPS reductase-like domain protein [Mycobacterium phage prophiGD25-1]QST89139.1 PAPS reductase-like domain protein [Mycobacterium phage prophiGD39-2]QST89683.1 PAPS reductase-like domain protein [Mycobacterium phage prophi57-1]
MSDPMSGSARVSRHRPSAPTLPFGYADDVPIEHDPLDPHPEIPTPIELVLALTRSERETRLRALIELSWRKYEQAISEHAGDKNIVATCSLVSGGDDSYTVANVFRDVTTHHVHANTETGIEATREFVRHTASSWGLPLIEHRPNPGQGYFDLVRGTVMARSLKTGELVRAWPGGFPGPAAHAVMYQRLKQRALARVPHDLGISGSRSDRVVFIAGRRRPESKVRSTVPYADPEGTILWVSPMAVWHKADLRTYRLMFPKIPRNPVARTLGMSGECGCLANAAPGEADRWRTAYPRDPFILKVGEVEAEIAHRVDIPDHRKRWGWGGAYADPDEVEQFSRNAVCSGSCGGEDPLLDIMDPLFEVVA